MDPIIDEAIDYILSRLCRPSMHESTIRGPPFLVEAANFTLEKLKPLQKGEARLTCPLCGRILSTNTGYCRHLRRRHYMEIVEMLRIEVERLSSSYHDS